MPTLEQFGYKSIQLPPTLPLVVVLAQGADRPLLAHSRSEYQEVLFGQGSSVAQYFSTISNGRFTFTPAGNGVYGPLKLTKQEMDLPLEPRFPLIMKKLVEEEGFKIEAFDANADSTVDDGELIMVVIDSDSLGSAARRPTTPSRVEFNGHQVGWSSAPVAIGHQASFMSFCHELAHVLGIGAEMYGSANLNANYTTMDATIVSTPDDRQRYHLDPFHKMKLGWCEPRLYNANTVSTGVPIKVHSRDYADGPVLLYDGNDEASRRFFMLEYRTTKVPFDDNVGSIGIAIWRVELDAGLNPFEIPGANNKTDSSVNIQGPPSWARGKGPLWRAGKTPYLQWPPKCSINIQPFQDYDAQVLVDITV